MKLLIFYFDHTKTKMFVEKETENGQKSTFLSTVHNFVSRDEILCRIVDAENEEDAKRFVDKGHNFYQIIPFIKFKPLASVYFDQNDRTYKSSFYGFVSLDKAMNFKVTPPLQIDKSKTKAYYIIHATKFGKLPTYTDIEEVLKINKIITPIDKAVIDTDLSKITKESKLVKLLVAQSKEPVNGREEYFEPLIDLHKKAGEIMSDGRMDFKEIGSIHEVKKNQEILKRFKEIKPVDGFDIYGEKKAAVWEKNNGYKKGDNIVQSGKDEDIFVSSLDGCLQTEGKKISVKEIVVISKNVDYETGNINYHGSVHVRGGVLPGFSVKADGDIIIEGNVEDAQIDGGKDVTVKGGVCGKGSTFIKAGGNVTAKYMLNSKVEAQKCVYAEDSIINCDIFSNDKVFVVSQHAKIMGGKVTARHRIEANFAGSQKEANTILSVGRNLDVEKELAEVRKKITEKKAVLDDVMISIRTNFGNNLFEDPKKFISILPAVKKKQCLKLLSDLTQIKKEIQDLNNEASIVESKLVLDETPLIIIKEKVFAGTLINVKKQNRKIEEDISNAKFYEDEEQKVVRYTSAL